MIGSYYKLTNVYNLFNSFNSLDMIISSIYISKEKDLYLPTGQKLVNCNTINMHASVPVFVSSITLNDKIDLTYCIRTK